MSDIVWRPDSSLARADRGASLFNTLNTERVWTECCQVKATAAWGLIH